MDNKIKVLQIISDTNIGGAGRLLINLSECIDKSEFEFAFAIPGGSLLLNNLQKEGSVHCYAGHGDSSFEIKALHSLIRIIKKELS